VSGIYLDLARIAGFVSRRLENKLILASLFAWERSGRGPWEIV
jgi:hypothetical protein